MTSLSGNLERVLQRTTATISSPVLSGSGDLPNPVPTEATVTITRADGAVVVSSGTANPVGSGIFTYDLTITDTSVLDVLTVEWTNPTVGTTVTTVEIVGGFLFAVPAARLAPPLNNTDAYTS